MPKLGRIEARSRLVLSQKSRAGRGRTSLFSLEILHRQNE